ncbi:Nucleotide-binding universal stress protein, UspA family [Peptoclostridium litorale DSM 5388]|uniref:UspA domain-containing protein n=1 Tax=Peptoclostridium litorale DSM 5388 TaxID=1121324 RepID=A0A069RDL7_PEPLI|nr:universal stress protein [Peptoclostridium litorale]KDR95149.1 hypothetical protein CLIT_11c01780 [Peptoclostridium litorale DSM 5388]SIN74210.1 Nucleotide-binding universal stress protein, UspA family [Peptoclostridium litorale DSM 5388]
MKSIKKILLPVDNLEPCTNAISAAKLLAQGFKSEIVILNVQADFTSAESDMSKGTRIVEEVKSNFKYADIQVTTRVAFGNPSEIILDICEDENFDMIIICTHGLSATRRFLLGSVTNKIVHHSKVPVLVLR